MVATRALLIVVPVSRNGLQAIKVSVVVCLISSSRITKASGVPSNVVAGSSQLSVSQELLMPIESINLEIVYPTGSIRGDFAK
jgi:hypothetical protein